MPFVVYCDNENIPYQKCEELLSKVVNKQKGNVLCWKIFAGAREIMKLDESVRLRHRLIVCQRTFVNDKNSADITLTIDLMKDLYRNPAIDTFIICSNDSDFVPLCKEIQEHGKRCWLVIDSLKNKNDAIYKIFDKVLDIDEERQIQAALELKQREEQRLKAEALLELRLKAEAESERVKKENDSTVYSMVGEVIGDYEQGERFIKDGFRVNINRLCTLFVARGLDYKKYDSSYSRFLKKYIPTTHVLMVDWLVKEAAS